MVTVTPFLWFPGTAGEALAFYAEAFADSTIIEVTRGGGEDGTGIAAGRLRLPGLELMLFNGPPIAEFTAATSLFVQCETQMEIDQHWQALIDGGQAVQCGWLRDRFGVSWQIVPACLGELLGSRDRAAAARAREAMLGMVKLDIAGLRAAHGAD
ncbi:MAG: VOC family protein, partial [Gaiellales bacterium]